MYRLSMYQRMRISQGLQVPVGKHQREGWSGALMFYAFKCKKHGIVENYAQGYRKVLRCPECAKT